MLTKEDLEYRKTRVGASDAPVIMGIDPWRTPLQLWEEKLGLREPKRVTHAIERGINFEDAARNLFILSNEITVSPKRLEHPEHAWMFATYDGITDDHQTIVEIKVPGQKTIEMAQRGEIPQNYYCQLQHQIAVANPQKAYYFCYDGNVGVKIDVKRDQDYIDALLAREREFYKCMMEFIPPALTDRDYNQRQDQEWIETINSYYISDQKEKEWTAQKLRDREKLIALADGKNTMGGGLRLSKVVKRGAIDYEKIEELKQVDLEKYRKKNVEYWRIS